MDCGDLGGSQANIRNSQPIGPCDLTAGASAPIVRRAPRSRLASLLSSAHHVRDDDRLPEIVDFLRGHGVDTIFVDCDGSIEELA